MDQNSKLNLISWVLLGLFFLIVLVVIPFNLFFYILFFCWIVGLGLYIQGSEFREGKPTSSFISHIGLIIILTGVMIMCWNAFFLLWYGDTEINKSTYFNTIYKWMVFGFVILLTPIYFLLIKEVIKEIKEKYNKKCLSNNKN